MRDRFALLGVLVVAGALVALGAVIAAATAIARVAITVVHHLAGRALARLEG